MAKKNAQTEHAESTREVVRRTNCVRFNGEIRMCNDDELGQLLLRAYQGKLDSVPGNIGRKLDVVNLEELDRADVAAKLGI